LMIAGRSWGCGLPFAGSTGALAAILKRPLWVEEKGVGAGGSSALNGASNRRGLNPQSIQQHRRQPLAADPDMSLP
jgi:hypothetical protein